jgi:hypothetical protein
MKKVTIVCPQGGVYYAFFSEDERPNFEQSGRKRVKGGWQQQKKDE